MKTNTDYSTATAQRYMREAKAVQAEPAADLASAWAAATMQERGEWLSKQHRMFEALWRRVKDRDAVMAHRGQAKGSYSYM